MTFDLLISTWKNQKEKDVFVSKRTFVSQNKSYSSFTISLKQVTLNHLNIDLNDIDSFEFAENKERTTNITEKIFKSYT